MHPYQHGRRETQPKEKETMECHPDFAPAPPAKPIQVYRVTCKGDIKPGDLIEALVVTSAFDKAIKAVKGDSRHYANIEGGLSANPGMEGQVLMARYAPKPE
jgi:hypothetical protein